MPACCSAEAAKSLGYHPFPAPIAIASAAYVNNEGIALGACEYCGFCNRMACETNAKASANSTVCRCCARIRSSSCARAPM